MDEIFVIVPIFNQPVYTKLCLDALLEVEHGASIVPVLVNNNSRPKIAQVINEWIIKFEAKHSIKPILVSNDLNKGFSGGVNAGIAAIPDFQKQLICILHNDTIVFPGWAGKLKWALLETDEDIAIVSPRTSYASEGSPCIPELRQKFEQVKLPNKSRPSEEEVKEIIKILIPDQQYFLNEMKNKIQLRTAYSPEICSFCMLTKGEFFEKYGKFDEDFWPRGWEEKFWFRSMERDGWVSCIANEAFVFHFGNISSDGSGFCWPDITKLNEEKFKEKCKEADRIGFKKEPTV